MLNSFEIFDLPLTYYVDQAEVKRKFYALSRAFHPDFHTTGSEADQIEALEQSTAVNSAYVILSDENKRLAHILEILGVLPEEGSAKVPTEFLMEMMEVNERIMEWQMNPDQDQLQHFYNEVEKLNLDILDEVQPILKTINEHTNADESRVVVDYYLKHRYLLCIKKNLDKFAGQLN